MPVTVMGRKRRFPPMSCRHCRLLVLAMKEQWRGRVGAFVVVGLCVGSVSFPWILFPSVPPPGFSPLPYSLLMVVCGGGRRGRRGRG